MRNRRTQEPSAVVTGNPTPNGTATRGQTTITDRELAETALRQSEDRYRDLVEHSHDMIYTHDLSGVVLFANQTSSQILGLDPSEVVGKRLTEFLVPEVRDQFDAYLTEISKNGVASGLMLVQTSAGETRVCEYNNTLRADDAGGPIVRCIARDVTERNRAEQKLWAVLEAAPDAMVITDHDGAIVLLNSQTEKLFGYSREALLGQKIEVLVPERFRDQHHGHRAGYFASPKTRPMGTGLELLGVRKDGTEFPVDICLGPLETEEGKLVISTIRDITERKRTEETLREAEQKYRDIFDNAVEGIFQTTPDGRFITANPAMANMLGYESADELIATLTNIEQQEYVHPERRAEFRRLLEQQGTVEDFEFECYRKDGSKIWQSENVRAVRDTDGKILYYEGTAEEVTGRKRAAARSAAFAALAQELSGARNPADAARIIVDTADELIGWDACTLHLYDADQDLIYPILNIDTINGQRLDVTPSSPAEAPSLRSRQVIDQGATLILREAPYEFDAFSSVPFGDISRPSASIICVPMRRASTVVGLLSIQSYTPRAYDDDAALNDLQALADYCGEALNRIRVEVSLRENEQRFRQIAENLEDVLWMTDRGARNVLYVNPAYEAIWGRSRASLYQRQLSFVEAVHSDDREHVQRMLEGQPLGLHDAFEYRIVKPDGSIRWIRDRSFPIRNNEGEIYRIAGVAEDITERKLQEDVLHESEAMLKHSQRVAVLGHYVFDVATGFWTSSEVLDEIFGIDVAYAKNVEGWLDTVHPEQRYEMNVYLRDHVLEERNSFDREYRIVRINDGAVRWVHGLGNLEFDTEGQPARMFGVIQDITERKLIEEALRESEERYRTLFDNSKDAIYVHDLDGNYTSVNPAAEKLSGYRRDELIGRNFADFIAIESIERARENLWKKVREKGGTTYETEIVTKDGKHVPVEVSSRLIYANGAAVGVQGSARDITEPRRIRQALQNYSRRLIEAQEAERQNIARELHDQIGQMLTALKLNTHAIQGARDQHEAWPLIADNLNMLDEALEQVRNLSIDLRPALLDDLGLVTALRWYVERQAARTGVRTEFTGDSLDPDVRFSSELETTCFRIAQEALTNVARHAQAKLVTVRLSRDEQHLNLLIKDDGVGFDIEALQGHALASATLGLRGMEERAHAVRGRIKIDSATGRGTEVLVELPIAMSNGTRPRTQKE